MKYKTSINLLLLSIALCMNNVLAAESTVQSQIAKISQENWQNLQAQLSQVNSQIKALNLTTVLQPESLISNAEIAKSREKVKEYHSLNLEIHKLVESNIPKIKKQIANIQMTALERKDISAGLARGEAAVKKDLAELTLKKQATYDSLVELLDLAEKNLGKSRVQNGQLAFDDSSATTRYNQLLQRFGNASDTEEATKKRIKDVSDQSRKRLEAYE